MEPCTTALFSSGVPCTRFLAANFGTSARTIIETYDPLSVKMSTPFGLSPHVGFPSGVLPLLEMNFQVPISCSLSVFCCACAPPIHNPHARTDITSTSKSFLMVRLHPCQSLPASPSPSNSTSKSKSSSLEHAKLSSDKRYVSPETITLL